ncbi:MAG TPA: ABC transporter permease [Candidatus Limnocylindria bacterium]|nr:ABC transporter permease [Candidatus Limnocylindria bacterium]
MNLIELTVAWLTDPAHWSGGAGIPSRLAEHIALSGVSLAIAMLIAIPVGIWIGHTGRFASAAVNLANIWRALPSLALIGIVLPVTAAIDPQLGFRVYPTLVAMVVLAIPPILVNTQAGIAGVDRDLVEAARAMGMRESQVVRRVELPLSLPAVLAGVRSASVQVVATLTLGAIFGSGGLGRYLVEGIPQRNDGMTFGGVVLVGALALSVEGAFVLLLRLIRSPGLARIQRVSATPSGA